MSLHSPARRTRRLARVIAGTALLAVMAAGNFASHHHSLLETDDGLASRTEDRFLTRHDPLSRASHWHAVIAVVHEQDCIACHNQRLVASLDQGNNSAPVASTQTTTLLEPARPIASSPLTSGPRAPPVLL